MEIRVFCKDVDGMGLAPSIKVCGNLKDAFSLKEYLDYDSEPFGFEVSVIMQTAHKTIEVRKEHPCYRVIVDGGFSELVTDDFIVAMARCMAAWGYGYDAVVERWKEYDNGVKRWEPIG